MGRARNPAIGDNRPHCSPPPPRPRMNHDDRQSTPGVPAAPIVESTAGHLAAAGLESSNADAAPVASLRQRLLTHAEQLGQRLAAWNRRWPWAVALASFVSGVGSFALVHRGADMAQWIGALAVLCGLWLLAEGPIAKLLNRLSGRQVSPVALSYVTQALQQEILFFALPFVFGATRADLGQWLFTLAAAATALVTTIDPWYQRILLQPLLKLAFHAWCSFIAALVGIPLVLGLPLEYALPGALGVYGLWWTLSLYSLRRQHPARRQRAVGVLVLAFVPLAIWAGRGHIPPAGLVVVESRITDRVVDRVPGEERETWRRAELDNGVYAFVSIQAPAGLSQQILFEWHHDDREPNVIPLTIEGNGQRGWRTWTRKRVFGENAEGRWRVDVRTPQGQLISRLHFDVE